MKKLIISLLIFLILITAGCKTIEYVYPEYELPPQPKREFIAVPETQKDWVELINYFNSLVSEWEQWAKDVQKIIEPPHQ